MCRESEEPIYFVSADAAAFGRELKPELAADRDTLLGDRAAAFRYYNTIDALLSELAIKAADTPGGELIAESVQVRTAMKTLLEDPFLTFEIGPAGESGLVSVDAESLELISTGGPNVSYQIGGTTWACARPTWRGRMSFERIFYGPDGMHIDAPLATSFKMTTTLVLQVASDGTISSAEVSARSRAFGFEYDG